MRLCLKSIFVLNFIIAGDLGNRIQILKIQDQNLFSTSGVVSHSRSSNIRDDSTTIWIEDFEGDVSGWRIEDGWELTEESSYSPTHSFHMDDDNYGLSSSIVSPVISVPYLSSDNQILKLNFALWADIPDWNGDEDGSADDYYRIDIANITDVPIYFNRSTLDSYDGQNWWCSNPAIGGYLDAWVQVLQSPLITVPPGGNLSAMMKWGIEEYSGASVAGTCTDGWDAANVRISNDGGVTWNILAGDHPYDFNYGYGWIHNDSEYDCGGSLEQVAAGWGGQSDWHQVNFDLDAYVGQEVLLQFAFGSDPAYSTPDDVSLTGLRVDDIRVTNSDGDIVFYDNADDQTSMVPMNGIEFTWEQYFIDWGAPNRPGALDWEVYPPGVPLNGNVQLDVSEHAGDEIRIRFKGSMDDNDDGGNGSGLYIDDVRLWSMFVNDIPLVNNLEAFDLENRVELSWQMPPSGSYENEECSYADGTFENVQTMSDGTSLLGEYFDMPYGIDQSMVNSCSIWGFPNYGGYTTLKGFSVQLGIPQNEAVFSTQVFLQEGQWNDVDLDWVFNGDFVLAVQISTTVGIGIDTGSSPSQNSWVNNAGWQRWADVSSQSNGLIDGEFGITANVTTNGEGLDPEFNIYRSVNGDSFHLMDDGSNLDMNQFEDNGVLIGNEYCYQVTSCYGEEEGMAAGPVCLVLGDLTVNEIGNNIPGRFELKQNYPNPFNPNTTIDYSIMSDGYVHISLHDISGRKVRDIINEYTNSGNYSIVIDSKGLTSGMYFYTLKVKGLNGKNIYSSTRKMAFIK